MTTISVENLTKVYGSVRAVDDLSFTVQPGTVTGFVGANGAGKTTTMRILLGLAEPTSGKALIGGVRYAELTDPIRRVGAMIDPDTFHPGRTGRAALRIIALAGGVSTQRVEAVLDQVGLGDAAHRRVRGYSTGMRQRLALAAALLGEADVLVLDEPANGLDPAGVNWLRRLLRSLADEGRTVLVSSHLLAELAQTADHIVMIDHGRLILAETTKDLEAKFRSASLEDVFLGLTSNGRSS